MAVAVIGMSLFLTGRSHADFRGFSLWGDIESEVFESHPRKRVLMGVLPHTIDEAAVCFLYDNNSYLSPTEGKVVVSVKIEGPDRTTRKKFKRSDNEVAFFFSSCKLISRELRAGSVVTATFKFKKYGPALRNGRLRYWAALGGEEVVPVSSVVRGGDR